jgi:hypothetical protein
MAEALRERGLDFSRERGAALRVEAEPSAVGTVANDERIALRELVAVSRSLEEVFLELTGGEAETPESEAERGER